MLENNGSDGGGSSRGSKKYLANKFGRAFDTILEDYNPDKYIDDENLYIPRIHQDKVDAYNAYAIKEAHFEYEKSLNIQPLTHSDSIILPTYRERWLAYLLSMQWDRVYLVLFSIWCILYGITMDKYLIQLSHYTSHVNVTQSQILTIISILPIFMLITALIPCLTVCVTMLTCHQSLKKSSITTMQHWSIVAIFLSQFIEFNYHEFKSLFYHHNSNRIQPLPVVQHNGAPGLDVQVPRQDGLNGNIREVDQVEDGVEGSVVDLENRRMCNESHQNKQIVPLDNSDNHKFNEERRQSMMDSTLLVHQDIDRDKAEIPDLNMDMEVNKVYPRSMFVETGEFVANLRRNMEEQQVQNEKLRKFKLQRQREQALIKDPSIKEWTCLTCNRFNSEPVLGYHDDALFVVEGDEICPRVFMKQMEHSVPKPICAHCMTPYDYAPPDCSRHIFPQKGNKITAFANYPIPHHHQQQQAGVNVTTSWYQRIRRFIKPSKFQRIEFRLPMDWRLPLYLSSQLPEPLRYDIQGPSYSLGEVVECRVQKLEWTKAKILNDRNDGFYDIRYESGEEVRRILSYLLFISSHNILFDIGELCKF